MSNHPTCARFPVQEISGIETYKIGSEATITLNPASGYVAVSCSWHHELNGCHYWTARGGLSLHAFLLDLNQDYAMGKLFNRGSLEEFDLEASIASLKRETLQRRRSHDITADEARDLWDQIEGCDTAADIANISDPYGNTYYEHITMVPKRCASWFWDCVWGSFIQHIRAKAADQTNPEGPQG